MEETLLISEKRAATTALAGWRRKLGQSLQPETGEAEVKTFNIIQRIRSLDAAWARFDKAYVR